jgi:hypothetical protein
VAIQGEYEESYGDILDLIVSMSLSWLLLWTAFLQDMTIEGNWVKDTWDLSALFLRTA